MNFLCPVDVAWLVVAGRQVLDKISNEVAVFLQKRLAVEEFDAHRHVVAELTNKLTSCYVLSRQVRWFVHASIRASDHEHQGSTFTRRAVVGGHVEIRISRLRGC